MLNLTGNHQKKERPHLESMCLPLLFKCHFKSCANGKETVSAVPSNLTSAKVQVQKDLKRQPDQRDFAKRCITERPTVSLYLNKLLI